MDKISERHPIPGLRSLGIAGFALLLLACGGGGGGGGTVVTPPPSTYTVTYSGNGSTAGTVPVDTGTYLQGATVTLLGNAGSLAKTGSTFTGWNTLADGSGYSYTAGQTCTMGTANLTFYAHWTAIPVAGNLTYDPNGATGGAVPVDTTTYAAGQTVTVLGNTGSLVYTGYSFVGWQTKADGSGTTYKAGQTFSKPSTATTLYALWSGGQAYAVNYMGGSAGTISQYTIGPKGALTPMSTPTVNTGGNDPRYITADPFGKFVYASNITSQTVGQFTVGTDGSLTAMATPTILMGPTTGGALYYPSGLTVHPNGKFAYVSLQQKSAVNQYAIGPDGSLAALSPATVTSGDSTNGRNGPCAVAVESTGAFAYVANGGANTISQYKVNPDGTLSALNPFLVSSGGLNGSGSAFDIKTISIASGEYAYAVNYFDGTVAQYKINTTTGQLVPLSPALVTAGTYGLGIAVHPTGKFLYATILAGTASSVVAQFTIDPATGALTAMTPATVGAGGAGAASITVEASGKFAFATSGDTGWGSYSVAQYTIDPTTGALTLMANPTVVSGFGPSGIVTIGK
jgi:uncharacterized repeat protein (TIGR02543 family)